MIHPRARRTTVIGLTMAATIAASLGGPAFQPAPARGAAPAPAALVAPTDAELRQAATTELPAPPVATAADLDVATLADQAFAIVNELPAPDWEIDALADSLDDDPSRAFAFVRDSIRFEAYPGVLRGAVGTLAARAGNSEDRALLLGALLDAMHVTYRFAIGELDQATAQQVAARTFDGPTAPLDATDGSRAIRFATAALALRARRDDALLRLALGDRLDSATGGPAPDLAADVRHHVWVQVAWGTEWLDEDPTLPDAHPGQTLTAPTSTVATLPASDDQTVTVDVLDQTLQAGQLTQDTVLTHTFDAASASPSEIFLYFQPDLAGLGGTISEALGSATSYLPVLLVNGAAQEGRSFPVKPSKDVFGGGVSTTDPVVAGLQLRVTVGGPGTTSRTATRTLLDRVPPDAPPGAALTPDQLLPLVEDGGVPDVLSMIHHIAVSTGSTSLRAFAGQQGAVLDFIGQEQAGSPGDYGFGSQLWPVAAGDLGLVMMSERELVPTVANSADVHSYVASPRVYLTSLGPDATPDVTDLEKDLMLDGVRIAASHDVPGSTLALARLWYGVLQSSLETEQALGDESGQDPGTATVTGVSLAMTEALSVIDGGPARAAPPGAPAALRQAVADGLIAVVPGQVDSAQVWWTIDPVTGDTRSVLDPGLGGIARSEPTTVLASGFDVVYGKSVGAGNKSAGNFPKQGASKPVLKWDPTGNSYEHDGKTVNLNRPEPPPSKCGPRQEEMTLIGCISIPGAWAIRGGVLVAILVAGWYVNKAWQSWIGLS